MADLDTTRAFYEGLQGCRVRRTDRLRIDFDFFGHFGHQIPAHLKPEETVLARNNAVDGDQVPVRHFGAIPGWDAWHRLADRLKAAGARFIIEPRVRKGEAGEQATFFILDPDGNALEFKSLRDMGRVFAS